MAWCDARIDAGDLPQPPREWTVRENRWLAGRYGVDARLIVEDPDGGKPQRRPIPALVEELVAELAATASVLGTRPELDDVVRIATEGSGTNRQRQLIDEGGTLLDVVHFLVDELASEPPAAT